jgi:hypothetical protein
MGSRGLIGLHFVVSDGLEKPNPELRKLIRSHVMLGKNQGKKLPPRKRKTKVVEKLSSSSSDPSPHQSQTPMRALLAPRPPLSRPPTPNISSRSPFPTNLGQVCPQSVFADALEPGTIEVVLQCELTPAISVPVKTAHLALIQCPPLPNRCCFL